MNFEYDILTNQEKITLALRTLYGQYGYENYKMRKFEEYDLYSKHKDFLISDNIITFNDIDGTLKVLKPDVTLSLVKNIDDDEKNIQKLCYNENVYRVAKGTNTFKEILQSGLECIGPVDDECIKEVLLLAGKSLELTNRKFILEISNLDITSKFLARITDDNDIQEEILKCAAEKNTHEIADICEKKSIPQEAYTPFLELLKLTGNLDTSIAKVEELAKIVDATEETAKLAKAIGIFENTDMIKSIKIDFSVVDDRNYYTGIIFKGFVEGISECVLSGGEYNNLMQKMQKRSKAVGFAVYVDKLDRIQNEQFINNIESTKNILSIALPKGRLGESVYDMFEKANFKCPDMKEKNRKLIFNNEDIGIRYFWVKPSDVAVYVEKGVADIGIVGKDILLEKEPDVYELMDLGIGRCNMCVASTKEFSYGNESVLRVATEFANVAKKYYASKGKDIDIIHLHGSIEIAPILDLADVIVDIVETGTTLKENDLEVKETIFPISARLVANKSNFKFKETKIQNVVKELYLQMED